jgi:ATP-dependent RNA helicase MSS116
MPSASSLALMFAAMFLSVNGFLRPSSVVRISSLAGNQAASSVKLAAATTPTPRSSATELHKISNELGVSPEKVRELLIGQRRKLIGTEAKAKHIDWLLDGTQDHSKHLFVRNQNIGKSELRTLKPVNNVKKLKNQVRSLSNSSRIGISANNKDPTLLTNVEFAQRSDLHPATKRALSETLGLTSMTEIQAKTYAAALSGKDVLGRARTGTGKTIAFLLPSIERVLRSPGYNEGTDIGILIISPTRELAMQIGNEAEKLLTFHREMSVQVVFGGTKVDRDVSRLKKQLPTVLVATPGRLKDLLQTATVSGTKLSKIMSRVSVVVLDETDQLLDLGFRREIQQILKFLPRNNNRQSLLFSATLPPDLKEIMSQTMNDDYVEVDCIQDGDNGQESTQTHVHVQQSHAIIPSVDQYVSSVIRIVKEAVKDGDGNNKIVVFFPTARMVSFFADVFNEVVSLPVPVLELHSRKSQAYRNRVSSEFRIATSGLLLTSDVSARGVDYPGVTHVVQFGMPSSKEQYIHRLGRTGRAGADGKGWLILGPFESLFLEEMKKIHLPRNDALVDALNSSILDETDELMQVLMTRVRRGDQILVNSGEGAYQAFLGYYLGQMKRMKMSSKENLVQVANEFSLAMGFSRAPVLAKTMVSKMGLTGISGITVKSSDDIGGTAFKEKNRKPLARTSLSKDQPKFKRQGR